MHKGELPPPYPPFFKFPFKNNPFADEGKAQITLE